ncbi:molecular chaperone HscC [Paraburkholderia phytofirmans]|uniref:2-alkenal reductase n=1 Tax=Paraburkholderia phytofirmans (strain DSM 17436 / LMG 22146 / PsJN) TaxID=398527 RepID=B2TA60_PARPJ|nr:molecular chaperone HscC [Paraburkholderia phytofirmans]ACD21362.1 2-alkenal reductase [Paraburkholderia phytofirmans PsJN]
MPSIIGIDLGTTHSLAAIWRDDRAVLIPNALGETLTPSCVSIDGDGSILVGRPAHDRLHTHPERTAANFKRYMGTSRAVSLGTQTLRPEELSSLVLKSLKADAEAFLGATVSDAVIAVPAYFSDAQRKATRIAGELAGLNVLRLVNEPTAASLAYGVHQRDSERKFLIFDLGGGTFDVSVLDFFEGVMEVRASTGDNFLGGEDFTDALVELFCQRNGLKLQSLTPVAAQRLHQQAERAKRQLTQNGIDSVTLELTIDDNQHVLELDAAAAERTCEHLLQRLRKPVERALRDSKIAVAALDEIILVGGASRMPMVRKLVSKMFGRLPAGHLNPDEVVALGAAVQAGLVGRDAGLDEMVLTDVAPYSLGIDTAMQVGPAQFVPGHFLPIIERNTIVPVSRMQRIFTVRDRQQMLSIKVFQGEARLTTDNVALGEFTLEVPLKAAGDAGADVRFTYDINGVLEVEATAFPGGVKRAMVIEENPGVMTAEEIRQRLAALSALKIHPRDQLENRTLMTRADRVYEETLGDHRQYLAAHIARFQALIERQDADEIARARGELSALLDRFDVHVSY